MALTDRDRALIGALSDGLQLTGRPYARLGQEVGMSEAEVLKRLQHLQHEGVINRFGVIVHHHALGYRANAMAVWDVPDFRVAAAGQRLAAAEGVSLCYQRPRRLPLWPYNLFCMLHGRDRDEVKARARKLSELAGLLGMPHELLFSRRRFKQTGAQYGRRPEWTTSTA